MKALISFDVGIALLLLSLIHFDPGFSADLEIGVKPRNPMVEVGDTLILNCTIAPPYNATYNARNLYFTRFSLQNFTDPHVQVLSNGTAQLRLPNITVSMKGRYNCYLPEKIQPTGNFAQFVYVFRRPLQPALNGCIVSNWERMECSWSPSGETQKEHTLDNSFVHTLVYRIPGDDDNWKTCPQNDTDKCIWPASQFKMGANYCIQINATNVLKRIVSSDVTCVLALDDIVKPNRPENVESSFASDYDGHVTLRWSPPRSTYEYELPLVYRMDIQSRWQDQAQMNYVITPNTSVRFSVVPATNYTLRISVRPSKLGVASDKVVKTFESPSTVPCRNPRTQSNAFTLVKGSQKVLLYWQPIAERDFCGRGLSYEVRARQASGATGDAGSWQDVSSFGPSVNSAEVMLGRDDDEVTIQSKNSFGLADLLPHVVFRLPSPSYRFSVEGNASLNYRLIVEGTNNSVTVNWFATAPVANVRSYTLFWCRQISIAHICRTPIQWQNLIATEVGLNLTLSENYLNFQVGLAVNFLSGFTIGIMWTDKLYSQTAKAKAPQIVDVVAPYLRYGEIDLSWTPAPCNVPCAYIHTFVISYCLANHQNMCQGEVRSESIESWKEYTYSLTNLEHGFKYRIWMSSVSRTGKSKTSDPRFETTTKSWATTGVVIGIVFAIIFVGTAVVGGLYVILTRLNKYRKKLVNGFSMPVALPPTQRIQSISSETPMLTQQVSFMSDDSGRCSLTPASQATSPLLSEFTFTYSNGNLNSFMPTNFVALEDKKAEDDNESTQGCVLSYTFVSSDAQNGKPALPYLDGMVPTNFSSAWEDMKAEEDDENRHGCVVSYTIVSNDAQNAEPALPSLDSIKPTIFSSASEDIKAEDDDEGPQGCVVSYTFVSSDSRRGEPNGAEVKSGHTIPGVASNRERVDHSSYILPEQIEQLGMFQMNSSCTESDVNYCASLNLSHPSADYTPSNDAAGIAYAKIETIHGPFYDTVKSLAVANGVNERSVKLLSDPGMDDPATCSENRAPHLHLPTLPRFGDNVDARSCRGCVNNGNLDCPSLSSDDVDWISDNPDISEPSRLSMGGYVDHAMFGIDSVD